MSQPITQAEFARRHSVSPPAVRDWVRRQVISVTPEGLIDEEAAIAAIAAVHDPARQQRILISGQQPIMAPEDLPTNAPATNSPPPPTETQQLSFHAEKTRLVKADADLAELKLARESGALVARAAVESSIAALISVTRIKVLATADAPDVPEPFRARMRELLRNALLELAHYDPRQLVETD